jgi:hypothetical protein
LQVSSRSRRKLGHEDDTKCKSNYDFFENMKKVTAIWNGGRTLSSYEMEVEGDTVPTVISFGRYRISFAKFCEGYFFAKL